MHGVNVLDPASPIRRTDPMIDKLCKIRDIERTGGANIRADIVNAQVVDHWSYVIGSYDLRVLVS